MLGPGIEIFKFAPFKSFVHPTYWYKLVEIKLDIDKLSDAPRTVYAYYSNYKAKNNLIEIDYSAFNNDFQPPQHSFTYYGTLYLKNSPEDFRDCSKLELLTTTGNKIQNDIDSGAVLENPCLLNRFLVLSYLNLKAHKYYYWFAFPVPSEPNAIVDEDLQPKKVSSDSNFTKKLTEIYSSLTSEREKAFFIILRQGKTLKYFQLKDLISNDPKKNCFEEDLTNVFFCFADSSEFENPSWVMRNFIYFLFLKCEGLRGKVAQFLGVRLRELNDCSTSLIWQVTIPRKAKEMDIPGMPPWVGWEVNKYGKVSGQCAEMAESMDPLRLAENAVNLNLKLMKWRLVPDLDLNVIANAKCLLFGAGTLGCAVARCLLAWGVKTITFIDNGKVTYSNPVRQFLYTHEDARRGDRLKAECAAERLLEINPNIVAKGIAVEIPMPGHPVGIGLRESEKKVITKIEDAVKEHDVLFLLTDSRESRWLPTLFGALYKKIVISAALGFDSYLVIRHGSQRVPVSQPMKDTGDLKCIGGSDLGCYFCNDVTAPGNSMKGRTLDQQCTVTRPGVSSIAASYAVELLVSLLQQEEKDLAPAYFYTATTCKEEIPEGLLGIIPHSIRGSLTTFSNILPATSKFPHCIACSERVINEYKERGVQMLFDVFDTNKYLEDIAGITKLKLSEKEITEIEDFDNWSE